MVEREIIRDKEGMRALAEQWNALADVFNAPLLRFEWFEACAEAFCLPGKLSIVSVTRGGRILAIAPLVLEQRFGYERLELLGAAVLCEPSGFLYRDEESLSELIN